MNIKEYAVFCQYNHDSYIASVRKSCTFYSGKTFNKTQPEVNISHRVYWILVCMINVAHVSVQDALFYRQISATGNWQNELSIFSKKHGPLSPTTVGILGIFFSLLDHYLFITTMKQTEAQDRYSHTWWWFILGHFPCRCPQWQISPDAFLQWFIHANSFSILMEGPGVSMGTTCPLSVSSHHDQPHECLVGRTWSKTPEAWDFHIPLLDSVQADKIRFSYVYGTKWSNKNITKNRFLICSAEV